MIDPLEWEQEFIGNLCDHPQGNKAWNELKSAGMGDFSKFLLYQFHAFGAPVPAEVSKGLGDINSGLKKLQYADQVATEHQGGSRAEKFAAKRERASDNAGKSRWPFHDEQVKVFADAASAFSCIGLLPLDQAPAVIGDARQAVSRFGGKQLLMILRAGAKARGIRLSLTGLMELAYAAGQNANPLDKNTLQRFFALPEIKRIEQSFQHHFESSEEWDLIRITETVRQEIASKLQ
jgi:hypothetical protein